MDKKTNEALQDLVAKATAGDKKALETLVAGVQCICSPCQGTAASRWCTTFSVPPPGSPSPHSVKKTNETLQDLVAKATAGDKKALETLVAGVQDIVFNLSLRMLGSSLSGSTLSTTLTSFAAASSTEAYSPHATAARIAPP